MPEIPLEGFSYDSQKAVAMHDAFQATIGTARATGARTTDILAALGLSAALAIHESKIQRSPEAVARSLADFIVANARALGIGPRQGS